MSYQSDLADADSRMLYDSGDRFNRRVGAASGYFLWSGDETELSLEALGALRDFRELDGVSVSRRSGCETGHPSPPFALACHDSLLCLGRPASVPLRHTIASLGAGFAALPQMARRCVGCALHIASAGSGIYRSLRHCGNTLAPTPSGDYAPSLRSPWRAAHENAPRDTTAEPAYLADFTVVACCGLSLLPDSQCVGPRFESAHRPHSNRRLHEARFASTAQALHPTQDSG